MENEEIPVSERLLIERIRELDAEELEVEEVDDEESSDDDDYRSFAAGALPNERTYHTSLDALHSYLGDVEDTHNRLAFLDGGAMLTLPLFCLEGVVLFPEATLPLGVIFPNFIAGVERALRQVDTPFTIGVVRVHRDPDNERIRFSTTGTTAEIRQYRRLEDGSLNVVAHGQQRFHLRCCWVDADGALCGELHIIQEDLPLKTPREALGKLALSKHSQVTAFNNYLRSYHNWEDLNDSDAISEGSFKDELSSSEKSDDGKLDQHPKIQPERSRLDYKTDSMHSGYNKENVDSSRVVRSSFSNVKFCRDASTAFLPSWVYRMYDSYSLARIVADRWKGVIKASCMDSFMMKPYLMSFHIASKIPVSESIRQELLDIDGTSYRLRREVELLENFDKLCCRICKTLIAKRSDMLVMSIDGPLGAYANQHGLVHEVMTLMKTSGIAVTGPPVKEFSWFPGYAWSMAECISCGTHLGWHFSATNKVMRPKAFWGIRSSQVVDGTN